MAHPIASAATRPFRIHRWEAAVAGLMLLTAASRLPFRSRYPVNWDAVQYILGTRRFDIAAHQPHPPGNPLYVLAGRVAERLIADPNQALVAISILTSVVAVWGTALIGARLAGRTAGLWAGLLVAVNPLFWYYGEVALSYAPEAAVGVLVALAAWRAGRLRDRRSALLLALALALAGGVRPTVLPLLAPLWLFGLYRMAWRERLVAAAAALAGCLLWLVPLLAVSGGPFAYLEQIHRLAAAAVEPTSVLDGPSLRWLRNFIEVLSAAAVGLNLFGLLAIGALLSRPPALRPLSDRALFLWLWTLPALGLFVCVHFGQWGYLLLITPPLTLLGLLQLERAGEVLGRRPSLLRGLAVAASALVFLLVPTIPRAGVRVGPTRASIRSHDATWDTAAHLIRSLPADRTLVLTSAEALQSFRIASYLLPNYDVVGVAHDAHGAWGSLYQADGDWSTYRLDPQLHAAGLLRVPDIEYVVVLDDSLANRIPDSVFWTRLTLSDGTPLLVRATVPTTAYVSFQDDELRVSTLTALQAPESSDGLTPFQP